MNAESACVCVHVACTHTGLHVCVYTYIYARTLVYMCVYILTYMHAEFRVGLYIFAYLYGEFTWYVYIFIRTQRSRVCVCTFTDVHTEFTCAYCIPNLHVYMGTFAYMNTLSTCVRPSCGHARTRCAHTGTCIHMYDCTCGYMCMHAYIYSSICVCMYAYMFERTPWVYANALCVHAPTCTHICVCTCRYMCTGIHAYIYRHWVCIPKTLFDHANTCIQYMYTYLGLYLWVYVCTSIHICMKRHRVCMPSVCIQIQAYMSVFVSCLRMCFICVCRYIHI